MTVITLPTRGRTIELPIAPKANARIRFAPLQPLAAPAALPLAMALAHIDRLTATSLVDAVDLAGPGDPLVTFGVTLECLRHLAAHHPGLHLGLTSLGLGGAELVGPLKAAGLGEFRLLVDAVEPLPLEKIYAWIRPGVKTMPLPEAARYLIAEQRRTVTACTAIGLAMTVVTTIFPDQNSDHLETIARAMAALGAGAMVLRPYRQEAGADIVLPPCPPETLEAAAALCRRHLATTLAAGRGGGCPAPAPAAVLPQPSRQRPCVAVASSNGIDVDLHLGQARTFLVYGRRQDGLVCLQGTRPAPAPGGGGDRWRQLADRLGDCFAILCASAGATPQQQLAQAGITVLPGQDNIEGTVDVLFGGGKKGKRGRKPGRQS